MSNDLLVRVRLVSSLEGGQRLRVSHGRVGIEAERPWTPVMRWLYGDSRDQTIAYVEKLVSEIEGVMENVRDAGTWRIEQLRRMLPDLRRALDGLKVTYIGDPMANAQLDTLLDRVGHVASTGCDLEVDEKSLGVC